MYVVHVTVMYMYVGSVYVPHGTDRQMSHVKKTGTLHGECRHVRNTQGPEHLLWHITLQVGQQCLQAHKLALVGVGPFFQAIFSADMLESSSHIAELKGVCSSAVEGLVDFAYTCTLPSYCLLAKHQSC